MVKLFHVQCEIPFNQLGFTALKWIIFKRENLGSVFTPPDEWRSFKIHVPADSEFSSQLVSSYQK